MATTRPTALLLALVLFAGCGAPAPPPPPTYPVHGVVKHRDGKPFAHVSVYFRPVLDSGSPATAETDAEGRFLLHTFHGNAQLPGAREGAYRVMVLARMDPNQAGGGSVTLPAPVTIKASEDNELTLTVDWPHGQR